MTVDKTKIDTDNAEFQDAFNLIRHSRQSVFLTGKAGTGKSTFLKYICEITRKKYVVLAPTGVAAINAGGSTIHSFFKMPFRPMLPNDNDLSLNNGRIHEFLKYRKEHRKLLRELELVIIDEISMVRADMIDFIDRVLRVYSGNMRQPFGGKQMLFVGDVYQLEPVVASDAKEILSRFYPNAFFFSAKVFSEIHLVPIELKKVYRQSDPLFVNLLDKIRNNTITTTDLNLLNRRVQPGEEGQTTATDFSITLATRRDTVDFINEKRLSELPDDEFRFIGEIRGEFPESSLPTQQELILKPGAQIIFIKNDYDRRWVNGTIAIVSEITEEGISVILENGEEYVVGRDSWRNIRYSFNEKENKIEEKELGSFIQYPIRLAWAITVHKSQGLTFSRVVIDFSGGGAFACGQTYVALSRCRSLEGIVLKRKIEFNDIFVRPEIVQFSRMYNDRRLINRSLKEASADRLYRTAVQAYDKGEFDLCLQSFFEAIHARYDIEKPESKRLIRLKLNRYHQQQVQIEELKDKLRQQTEALKQYAYEYYLLGNECITKAHDTRSALANFDKALELDPTLVDAWVRKGITLYDQDKQHEALLCYNEALRLSPLSFKALYNKGKLLADKEDYDSALSCFLKAAVAKPKNPTVHDRIADLFETLDNTEMAEKYRKTAVRLRASRKPEK